MRSKLHLFFPENDLALARDLRNYTPPVAAVRLRKAGEALPLWFGDDGDRFVASGINASWLDGMKDTFGMDVDVYDYRPECYCPAPWGWSKASREVFMSLGFRPDSLPDDAQLEVIRRLSHRSTAAAIARSLADRCPAAMLAPAAEELDSEDAIRAFVGKYGSVVLKLPWSSSGRGLVAVDRSNFESLKGMLRGMLSNQGCVMGEKRLDKTLDFAMLFTMQTGSCAYNGLSVFRTVSLGAYQGNILASQAELEGAVRAEVGDDSFDAVRSALPSVLEEIIGTSYDGPLGVDMMAVRGEDFRMAPAVEMNLRMTMGHVCLRFYSRYVENGRKGVFMVGSEKMPDSFSARNGRMRSGVLNLVPPGGAFSFVVSLD